MNILFVCLGNINRSIAAEIILDSKKTNINIKSAALNQKSGRLITNKMRKVLESKGYQHNDHRSVAISEELIKWADLVFFMDKANKTKLLEMYPAYKVKYCALVGLRSQELPELKKIADPHFCPGTACHEEVVIVIEDCINNLIKRLHK